MDIGFIGLGTMGAPMARRLLDAGHRVTVHNRTRSREEPLAEAGAERAATPREAAEGAEVLFTKTFTPTKLIGGVIMFFAMLAATVAAVNTLGIDMITVIFGRLLEFAGGILVGAIILIVGNALGNLAHKKLVEHGSVNTANIARIAIFALVLSMGLKAMGLADNIVHLAFGLTLGGAAIAFALAFGLGGRDAAKKVADAWADKAAK